MNVFTQQRLNASIIAVLIVLNVASLGTIWFLRSRQSPPDKARGPKPVKNFLEQELDLTQEQAQHFETLRQGHFQESQVIVEEIQPLREAMVQEIFSDSPDSQKAKVLAAEIGEKHADLENLRFQHFLALKAVCQPEQLEKLQGLFRELFPPQPPPAEGRPPKPGPGMEPPALGEQRQGPASGGPREAIAACREKAQGSSCQFQAPHGTVTGICRSSGPQLACIPEDNGRRKPPPAP